MFISKSIIENIGEDVVNQYLRNQGISLKELTGGKEVEYLVSDLLNDKRLTLEQVKQFFFDELMFGKRRFIRVFNLDRCKKILYEEDWYKKLEKEFSIPSLEFNNIISTIPTKEDSKKIAAIHTEYDERREIRNINILFAYYIAIKQRGSTFCYIPVQFDLEKKLIIVKAWRRQNIEDEETYKTSFMMDDAIQWFDKNFEYSKKKMSYRYKEILYNMNKGIVSELFEKIPSYKDAESLQEDIVEFSEVILRKMDLENKTLVDKSYSIPRGVMDIQDELLKLIQRLAVADYFMNRDYNQVWEMGISAIVNSVKFNDKENVLAVVSGEDKRKPVFCSKSFLVLLKSMEESKTVNTIWISFKYDNRTIRVNYDASNEDYLEIGNLSNNKNFTRDEFDYIWEVLMQYESENNCKIEEMDRAVVS